MIISYYTRKNTDNEWHNLSKQVSKDEKDNKNQRKNQHQQIQALKKIPCVIKFSVNELPFIISKEICDKLCKDALPHLKPSKVYNLPNSLQELVRNSMFCSIVSKETDIVRNIASKLSGYPLSHVEYAQVVRYQEGQGFSEHYDTDPNNKTNPSWSRLATFMIYLNDDFIGGETEFPLLNQIVQPEQCKGLFWWNVNQNELITDSKHKGRYVIDGTKWIINTWVHSLPILNEKLKWTTIEIND